VSPDSTTVLSGDDTGALILWNIATGEEIKRLVGHTTSIAHLGFSRDGVLAFSSSIDNKLIIWDLASGEPRWELDGTTFVYLPQQNALLAGQGDNSLTLWDITTGRRLHQFSRQSELVRSIAVTPDETTAILAIEQSLILLDLKSGQVIHTFAEHTDQVFSVAVSPDGTHLLSGGDTRMIEWRAPSITPLLEWTRTHRYIRDLTCEERILYNVDVLCEVE
jgi:WD40 repeat protein